MDYLIPIVTVSLSGCISVLVAVVSGVIAYIASSRKVKAELQKEFESRFNQKKWKVYSEFARTITLSENLDLGNISADLLLVGSDEVIKELNKFTKAYKEAPKPQVVTGYSGPGVFEQLESVIIAMRKDLGYQTEISSGELTNLMFTKEYLES